MESTTQKGSIQMTASQEIAAIAELLGASMDDRRVLGVYGATDELRRAAKQIEDKIEDIRWTLDRTAEAAAKAQQLESYSINSLGVLQGSGPDLDRLCAILQEKSNHFASACWMAGVDSSEVIRVLS